MCDFGCTHFFNLGGINLIKYAKNASDFQENAKDYVINMLGNRRKLHKKNGCPHSRMFDKYYDFDTYEDAGGNVRRAVGGGNRRVRSFLQQDFCGDL